MKTDPPGSRAGLSPTDSREFDLRDTEELYRALVNQAPDAIFVCDHKFRLVEVNARACEMSGYSREEALRRSVFDFLVPEDVVANPLKLDELTQGNPVVNERRLKRKDGTAIPVEITAKLLSDGRLQGIMRDISRRKRDEKERKKLDAALRQSEQRFRALIEQSHDAIALFGADGAILYASPSTTRVMGYDPKEILQRNMVEFVRPDYLEALSERLADSLRHPGVGIPVESYVRHKDGGYRFLEGTFTNLLDEPSVGAIVNNYRDVTDRKQADEKLRESEEKYRTILERMQEGYAEVDLRGTYVFVNDSFCRITGRSQSELVGANYKEFFDSEHCQLLYDTYHQVYLTGEPAHGFEYVVTRKDGTKRLVEESVNLKTDAEGRPIGFTGIRRDVTERKRAEAALRESEEKLILAMRAANMGSWVLNMDTLELEADAVARVIHGFTADEPISEIYQSLRNIHPEDISETKRRFKQAFQTRGPFEREYRVVLPDGDTRWISSQGRVDKSTPYLMGMVQDITNRKRAQEKSAAFATLARKLSGASTQLTAARIIAQTARDLFGWDACNLDLYDAERDWVFPLLNIDTVDGKEQDVTPLIKAGPPTARGRRVINGRAELLLREEPIEFDPHSIPFGDTKRPSASMMSVPIQHGPTVIGMLSIQSYAPRAYDEAGLKDCVSLAEHCGETLNRIHAQGLLYESEERFRELAEHLEDVIWIADRELTRVLYINPAYETIFGRSSESLYTDLPSWLEAVHPDDRDLVSTQLERQRKGAHEPVEYRILRPDGSIRWILRRTFSIRNHEGEIYRIAGIGQDITERKEAEEALRESELRFRSLVTQSPIGIYETEPSGGCVFVNQRWAQISGLPPEKARGDGWAQALHPEDRASVFAEWNRTASSGKPFDLQYRFLTPQGVATWVHGLAGPVRNESGEIVSYFGTISDITERKQTEAALRESDARYRELFENSRDAIYLHDMSGRYLAVNSGAEELSGYSRDEILGKNFSDFVSAEFISDIRENFVKKLSTAGATMYEIEVIKKNGKRVPVEVSSRMLYKEGVPVAVQGTIRDISERKNTQAILREYSRRLVEAQEMERKKIARELHDEIGQILTAVRISLQSLQRTCEIAASPRIDDNILVIDEALERVRELSLELRPALLDDLGLAVALRWYLKRYCERTAIQGEVDSNFDDDLRLPRELETACFRISQEALTNVARHAEASHVTISLDRTEHKFRLTVSDDGKGFDAAAVLASASAESFGLHGIEERAFGVGGSIEIQSRPGHGTQLTAHFPLCQNGDPAKPELIFELG